MKRPEETNYFILNPNPKQQLDRDKFIISELIDANVFTLPDSISISPELNSWLSEYGWKIVLVQEGFIEWVNYLKPIEHK